MKDSSRADAEFIDTACHDPEFISAPSLPRPRGICHRVKLPRPENHRRSFPRISTAIPQMVITGGPPVIPDLFADPVITTRNVTRRGSFIPSLPPPQKAEGNLSASIFTTRNLSVPISTTRNLLVLIFRRGHNLSAPVRNSIDMFIDTWRWRILGRYRARKPHNPKFIDHGAPSIRAWIRDFISIFIATRFIASPFSRPEIHHH